MKVKIRDRIYDGEKEPIMVLLSEKDKEHIKAMMLSGYSKYCSFPLEIPIEVIAKWMNCDGCMFMENLCSAGIMVPSCIAKYVAKKLLERTSLADIPLNPC